VRPPALLTLALTLAACGSSTREATVDDPLAACPVFEACGGKLDGVWRIVSDCFRVDPGLGSKPGAQCAEIYVEAAVSAGTWSFQSFEGAEGLQFQGVFAKDVTITSSLTRDSAPSCDEGGGAEGGFGGGGGTGAAGSAPSLTCKQLEHPFRETPQEVTSVSCTARADRCTCTQVSAPVHDAFSGRFHIQDGNLLVLDSSPFGRYCVRGDDLFISQTGPFPRVHDSTATHLVRVR
jgi:hypothetical protein